MGRCAASSVFLTARRRCSGATCSSATRTFSLVGCEFTIQGATFLGSEECRPCYWMDAAFGPGAEAFLKGRGGLRARIVSDGVLRASLP